MIVVSGLAALFTFQRDKKTWKVTGASISKEIASTEHTYCVIFNYTQEKEYNAVMTIPGLKVLFQSETARNRVHPGERRNFVLIFELEDQV